MTCTVLAGDSWSFFDLIYEATNSKVQQLYNWCDTQSTTQLDVCDASSTECLADPNKYGKVANGIEYPITLPGTRASQWRGPRQSALIADAVLRNHHRIGDKDFPGVVVLYLGGNDLIPDLCAGGSDGKGFDANHSIPIIVDDVAKTIQNVVSLTYDSLKFVVVGYSTPNLDSKNPFSKLGDYCKPGNQRIVNETLQKMEQALKAGLTSKFPNRVAYLDNTTAFEKNLDRGTDKSMVANVRLLGFYLLADNIHLCKPAQHVIAQQTVREIYCRQWTTGTEDLKSPDCSR